MLSFCLGTQSCLAEQGLVRVVKTSTSLVLSRAKSRLSGRL